METITIDGLTVSCESFMNALKRSGVNSRKMMKAAQQARAEKYGIQPIEGGALTMPTKLARVGATDDDFADPVNYRYPIWASKQNANELTQAQLRQVKSAMSRLEQTGSVYDQTSRAMIERRIDEAQKRFEVGLLKAWEVPIVKVDEERRVVLGVVLKASTAENIRQDSQQDVISLDEVEAAAYGFMLKSRTMDYHHKHAISQNKVAVVESYLAPVDFELNGTQVQKGDWVAGVKFFDDALWGEVKAGEIAAFSIKGRGIRKPMGGADG